MEESTPENFNSVNQSGNSDSAELGNLGSVVGDKYSFEQLKEVYYLGMLNGATIWQLCSDNFPQGNNHGDAEASLQDNTRDKFQAFALVTDEIKKVVTSEQSIKDLASSTGMLLGVSAEILGLDSIV